MPHSTPFKTPYEPIPTALLRNLITYTLDLEVLLRHLSDETTLTSEDAATLVAKLAKQYRADLLPLMEGLEAVTSHHTSGASAASA